MDLCKAAVVRQLPDPEGSHFAKRNSELQPYFCCSTYNIKFSVIFFSTSVHRLRQNLQHLWHWHWCRVIMLQPEGHMLAIRRLNPSHPNLGPPSPGAQAHGNLAPAITS